MCYLITFGVPEIHAERVRTSMGTGFAISPSRNFGTNRVLASGYAPFTLTTGGCSCSLVRRRRFGPTEEEADKYVERCRQQGWSESKINRALADMKQSSNSFEPGICDEVLRFMGEVLTFSKSASLFVHFYSEQFASEILPSLPTRTVSWHMLRVFPTNVETDIVYMISA